MIIRLIADGEESLCNDFHNDFWKKSRTIDQWQWEFVPRAFGPKQIPMAIASESGKIVGTQALIPIRLVDKKGVYWSAKSEETLVAPEYRGQALGVKMYEVMFDYAQAHGIASIWGFTTATKALDRSGYDVPYSTSQLIFPLLSSAAGKLLANPEDDDARSGISFARSVAGTAARAYSNSRFALFAPDPNGTANKEFEFCVLDAPPSEAGEISSSFIDTYGGVTIYRDTEYLAWRLFDNPYLGSVVKGIYYRGQLCGWVAYTMDAKGIGYLLDIMVASATMNQRQVRHSVSLLLGEAVSGCRRMGAAVLRGWSVTRHPFDSIVCREARRLGFIRLARGHGMVLKVMSDRASCEEEWFVSRIFTDGTNG